MQDGDERISEPELSEQAGDMLPDREAMSLLSPGIRSQLFALDRLGGEPVAYQYDPLPPDDEAFVADEGGRGEVDGEPVYYQYDPLPPDGS